MQASKKSLGLKKRLEITPLTNEFLYPGDRVQRVRRGQVHDGPQQRRHRIAQGRSASGLRGSAPEARVQVQDTGKITLASIFYRN